MRRHPCIITLRETRTPDAAAGTRGRADAPSPVEADEALERMNRIRREAMTLSPEYVAWLDGDGSDPEPKLPPALRERMRELVQEMERELGASV